MNGQNRRKLWLSWVWANAWAELLGLGATFLLGYGLFNTLGEPQTLFAVLGFILLMTSTGIIEGSVVGWFQWKVLHMRFEQIVLKQWWLATLLGALAAWFLGSLPSSLMNLGPDEAGTTVIEPPLGLMLLFAAGMGIVLGVILALPQWRVLVRHVNKAWIWLPANSLAWGVGMALIFAGIDLAQRFDAIIGIVFMMVITLFVTGAAVGAIHGAFLIRMTRRPALPEKSNE